MLLDMKNIYKLKAKTSLCTIIENYVEFSIYPMLFKFKHCNEGNISQYTNAMNVNFDIYEAGFTKYIFLVHQSVTTAKIN